METSIKGIDEFIKQVYHRKYHSIWTCILGRNQSGKTNFALYQLERIHALGLGDGFGSNIPDLKAAFDIDFIEDYETLQKRCQMLNPNPKRKGIKRYFFVGDEMGDWAPKDQPWLNVEFIKKLQKVRKIGLSMIGCGIDRIDGRILNEKHFHGYFEKFSKANPTVGKYFDWTNSRITTLKNIRKTSIDYNTFNSANFFMQPKIPGKLNIPLDKEHELIKRYLETESWKKAGIDTKTGSRAVLKVLRFHMDTCLHSLHKESQDKENLEDPGTD